MRLAWILGISGLLPFYAGLLLTIWPEATQAFDLNGSSVQLSYGAIILSFMGAIHWGAALEREPNSGWIYATSVLPALFGWVLWGLSIANRADRPILLIGLALGFAALLVFDALRSKAGDFPAWYLRLRIFLTVGVCLSLGLGAAYY